MTDSRMYIPFITYSALPQPLPHPHPLQKKHHFMGVDLSAVAGTRFDVTAKRADEGIQVSWGVMPKPRLKVD